MADLTTEQLLAERGKTHGEYSEHARCTQALMRVMQCERNWPILSDMQRETLHMIAHKIGRIMTGNPDVADHYDDIAGYSKLISQRLEKPIEPFDIYQDPLSAVAVGLHMTREEVVESGMEFYPVDSLDGLSEAQRQMKIDAAKKYIREGETFSDATKRIAATAETHLSGE